MYEDMTFEKILNRALQRVPKGMDKRQGSVIYDAVAPACAEIAQVYIELDRIINESFADTQTREYLIKRAKERGLYPYKSSKAILKAEFNAEISIGSRFSLNDLNYEIIENINGTIYKIQCETPGTCGNRYFGDIIPIDNIPNLKKAEITELLIPGEDEEETEHFRQRYFNSFNGEAFGGNIKDYKEKVNKIQGVGGVKVYPVWNGGGTVKLVIIDSSFKVPSKELTDDVQEKIDPISNNGKGLGIAPIGHIVTVEGVKETEINIRFNITYQSSWVWEDIKLHAENIIDNYFKELNTDWENTENIIIRISQIETRILDLEGVIDIGNTSINGKEENLVLNDTCIAKRGSING